MALSAVVAAAATGAADLEAPGVFRAPAVEVFLLVTSLDVIKASGLVGAALRWRTLLEGEMEGLNEKSVAGGAAIGASAGF